MNILCSDYSFTRSHLFFLMFLFFIPGNSARSSEMETVQEYVRQEPRTPLRLRNSQKITPPKKITPPTCYEFPYRTTLLLEVEYEDNSNTFLGTAVMVYKNLALTAAHNLYNKEGKKAKNIKCLVQLSGNKKFYQFKPTSYGYLKSFEENSSDPLDYAFLYFQNPIGDQLGYLEMKSYAHENIGIICGYPHKIFIETTSITLWEGQGEIKQITPNSPLLRHSITCYKGQSGSCLRVKRKDASVAIGVHVAGNNGVGTCVKITKAVKENRNKLYKKFQQPNSSPQQFFLRFFK